MTDFTSEERELAEWLCNKIVEMQDLYEDDAELWHLIIARELLISHFNTPIGHEATRCSSKAPCRKAVKGAAASVGGESPEDEVRG